MRHDIDDQSLFSEYLTDIKADTTGLLSHVHQLKERLKQKNLHFLELNKVIERGLNIFLNTSKIEMNERERDLGTPAREDYVNIKNLLKQIHLYLLHTHPHIKLKLNNINRLLHMTVDEKYFSRAVEILLIQLTDIMIKDGSTDTIKISSIINYNHSILLTFEVENLEMKALNTICDTSFLQEVMTLHGIVLETRSMKSIDKIVMRIPAYRMIDMPKI